MDTRTLDTFLKIIDLGSFTKAAAELGYAQSTVTAQIKQLEEELGYPLFDRIGRNVFLTEAGKAFRSNAAEILRLSRQSIYLGKTDREIFGTLRIGVLESLLFSVMTTILPRYREIHPNVDVQVKVGSAKDLLSWLKENQLDMVYYSHDRCNDSDLHLCYCRKEHLSFVASPTHPLYEKPSVTLQDFLSQPLIMPERTGLCWSRLERIAAEHGLPLRCSMEVTSISAIVELLKGGLGCSFLPRYSISKELAQGALVELHPNVSQQLYFSQIVHHKNKWIPSYQKTMLELIRNERPETEA